MGEINWIDGILLVVLLLSSALGLFRGLIRGVLGIISLVGAFFIARQFGGELGSSMIPLLGQSAFTIVVGYVFVFLISALLLGTLTNILSRAAVRADLGIADKFGGLLFGGLRGGIISLFIILVMSFLPLHSSAVWRESTMVPVFGHIMKISVTIPALSGYRSYWRFDGNNRPQLVLQNLGLAIPLKNTESRLRQRDDVLDSLNDEILEQSLNQNDAAALNAKRQRDRTRNASQFQKVLDTLREHLGDEVFADCGRDGDCGEK